MIAVHQYTFSVDEDYQVYMADCYPLLCIRLSCFKSVQYYYSVQEYTMECDLCGHGEATVSILPDDPREKQLF